MRISNSFGLADASLESAPAISDWAIVLSTSATTHYGVEYFQWQSEIGRFGGWANLTKFSPYASPEMNVLDFGCGGGYLLANIKCRSKLGIEVNPAARAEATRHGVPVVASTSEVKDNWADLVVSNHALEHCAEPLRELCALLPKLVPGGIAVFIVPCEAIKYKYTPGDRNHHLYSWSPMSLANLFTEAGFLIIESRAYVHVWPPRALPKLLRSIGGRWLFDIGCNIYGALTYLNLTPCAVSQVRLIAKRPGTLAADSESTLTLL